MTMGTVFAAWDGGPLDQAVAVVPKVLTDTGEQLFPTMLPRRLTQTHYAPLGAIEPHQL